MDALLIPQTRSKRANSRALNRKTVLIVDESEETRDVLSIALERRGVRALTASVPRRGAEIAREQKPDLVVLDVDAVPSAPRVALDEFARDGNLEDSPIMAIGEAKFTASFKEGEFVAKPFHFAPLLEKIEAFLQSADDKRERG
ncbi:MAG: hypothetical protein IJM30_03710 [Thermoguttaceae bacterium]|nr:hypothetical protein [Thermoguttaceae bacterium]